MLELKMLPLKDNDDLIIIPDEPKPFDIANVSYVYLEPEQKQEQEQSKLKIKDFLYEYLFSNC